MLGKDILVMGGYGGMDLEARTVLRKTGENPKNVRMSWRKCGENDGNQMESWKKHSENLGKFIEWENPWEKMEEIIRK